VPVSILILTLNEERNLPACLEAVSWCDDIIVLDSFSTDRTKEIAEKADARVFQRKFDSFADQRNFALENIEFKHEWIFHLDADEIFTESLHQEMEQAIQTVDFDAYNVPSKMIFMGRWLRYSGMYPSYQVRLTRQPGFRFKMAGHGQRADIEVDRIGTLKQPYLHYSFSKGLEDWYERHNRYSTDEARAALHHRAHGQVDWAGLLAKDADQRRVAIRGLVFRLPFRPFFRFLYMYVLRRGFLDGMAGLAYCRLVTTYEFMIVSKIQEIRNREKS
jgi:glycosyltransferase involved in cell wall biosynthesis